MKARRLLILIAVAAIAASACGGTSDTTTTVGPVVPGSAAAGADVFKGTCSVCHGRDLGGVDGLGVTLAPNEFVASRSEDELVAFILVGRPSSDPDNTTGVSMPARGGNPSLSDQDIHDVAAFLKAEN